ncbi:hypothetical protein NUM3379_36000 [Kineococcus sp. NUM-3379]
MDDATYFATLPAKPLAAGVLFGDGSGRVLLVEPTYKPVWEVPGGIVDPGESPLAAARREVREELGLDRKPGRLWCVDWRAAAPPAPEAVRFLFDGGTLSAGEAALVTLPAAELRSWAFHDLDTARELLQPNLFRCVAACLAAPGATLYLEDGLPPAR